MAAVDAPIVSGTESLDSMNSLRQELPPSPPTGPPTGESVSSTEISFASQTKKPASQSATHSQPVPSRPIQTYRPQVPVPPIDRGLTELGDKGEAIVKQVLSGDSLLIRAQKGLSGPPPEHQITLTMIQAPRLGRRAGDSGEVIQDEPFAWASREFLRSLVIGEKVQYNTEITLKNNKITKVFYNNENLSEKIIQAGFAKLREQLSKKGNEEYDRIMQMKEEAESLKLGVFSLTTTDSIRNVQYISLDNATQFSSTNKGKELDGLVEQVITGNILRFCIPSTHQHFTAHITGIRCPNTSINSQSKDGDTQEDIELGLRAKYAVEIRLLQRDVRIRFDGIGNQVPLVTVLHVKGNIAEFLLQEGFARLMQWSQKYLPDQQIRDKYKQLENSAKQKGVRIWQGVQSLSTLPSYSADRKKYQAKVLEIASAEQLMLKTGDKSDSIHKVFLSSTRGPPRKESDSSRTTRALYDQPFFFEAREFLRKWLVGKKVTVEVDYTRPPQEQYTERTCVTLTALQGAGGGTNDNVKNVAEALIVRGLGLPIRHKATDDMRSPHMDSLLRAEEIAKAEGRGIHAKKLPDNATLKVAELSTDAVKARTFQSSLQRSGRVKAIVEYVTSGNRFRIYIPREQILISFILTGISCPKGPGGPIQGQEEPYGQEAINYSKEKVLQHEVNIVVDNIDKRGSFIGSMFYEGNKSLAQSLLEEGLAYLHSSAYGAMYEKLDGTEREAKRKRIRIWESYDETIGEDEQSLTSQDSKEYQDSASYSDSQGADHLSHAREMIVTEVHTPNCLWAQPVTTADTVRDFSAKMKEHFKTNPPTPGLITLKRNMKVAAKFMDNEWYRAEIQQVVSQDKFLVHYIDYGNSQYLSPDNIARLPDQYASLPPQAREFQLLLTVPPQDDEWCKEAQRELLLMTLNKHVFINIIPKQQQQQQQQQAQPNVSSDQALIYISQDADSDVGKQLISDGFLLVDSRRKDRRYKLLLEEYQHIQTEAKQKHLNVWQYGDIREDFVPEFGYTPKKPPEKGKDTSSSKTAGTGPPAKEPAATAGKKK